MICARTVHGEAVTSLLPSIGESRFRALRALFKMPLTAVGEALDMSADGVLGLAAEVGLVAPKDTPWRPNTRPNAWSPRNIWRLLLWYAAGVRVPAIALDQGRKPGSVYAKISRLGGMSRSRKYLVDAFPVDAAPSDVASPAIAPKAEAAEPVMVEVVEPVAEAPIQPPTAAVPVAAPPLKAIPDPIPARCVIYHAPPDEDALVTWLADVAPNLLKTIEAKLRQKLPTFFQRQRADQENLCSEVFYRLQRWMMTENKMGVRRWLAYDATKGSHFYTYVVQSLDDNKFDDRKKGHISEAIKQLVWRRDKEDAQTDYAEDDDEMERLTQRDQTAVMSLGRRSITTEQLSLLNSVYSVIERISQHYLKDEATRDGPEASMASLMRYTLQSMKAPEIIVELERERKKRVLPDTFKRFQKMLESTCLMLHQHGTAATLEHFGIAA